MWDFDHQRDLNKVICAMQMGKVAICDFKTIQPCMDTADRQLMSSHMGKMLSVGGLNDEVRGKSIFFLLTRKTRFVLFRILVGLMVSVRCSILSADFWSDTRFTPSRFPAVMGHYPRKCFRHVDSVSLNTFFCTQVMNVSLEIISSDHERVSLLNGKDSYLQTCKFV